MLRKLILIFAFALSAQFVHAAEAGKVIFVAGAAHVLDQALVLGASVKEGDLMVTGVDGYIYIKTIDNGLFILRPNTKARIATYQVDTKNPANTHIKLELLSGVARSKSGDAVKLARQNFRFNTPVAAIGVRGTDFTVFTDQETSRVIVMSGGITVSGFGGTCRPEGGGPCEGSASRELSFAQKGQLLQVRRDQAVPQLLPSGSLAPDLVAPPRVDEPLGKSSGGNSVTSASDTDSKKTVSLSKLVTQLAVPTQVVPIEVVPTVTVTYEIPVQPVPSVPPTPIIVVPAVQQPERQIIWGRWQPILDQPVKVDFVGQLNAKSELIAVKGDFALFRTPGQDYVSADHGTVGFMLKDGEAYIRNDDPTKKLIPAKLENGQLNVDFGKKAFATSLDVVSNNELFKVQAQGKVASNGRLTGDQSNFRPGYINVAGVLSTEKGGSAAYVFDGRLDAQRNVNGITYWGH